MPDDVDTKVVGKAFKVEINGQFLPIKSYSGGDPVVEEAESSTGKTKSSAHGHNSISELTITSYVTPNQKILADAVHKVVNLGQNVRFTVTITELAKDKSTVKTFVYDNCLLTSYDYPRLSANSGEVLCETATFKPEILEVS